MEITLRFLVKILLCVCIFCLQDTSTRKLGRGCHETSIREGSRYNRIQCIRHQFLEIKSAIYCRYIFINKCYNSNLCHSKNVTLLIIKQCNTGKTCSLSVSYDALGGDQCEGWTKHLYVTYCCVPRTSNQLITKSKYTTMYSTTGQTNVHGHSTTHKYLRPVSSTKQIQNTKRYNITQLITKIITPVKATVDKSFPHTIHTQMLRTKRYTITSLVTETITLVVSTMDKTSSSSNIPTTYIRFGTSLSLQMTKSDKRKFPVGPVIGGIVGAIFILGIVFIATYIIRRRLKAKHKDANPHDRGKSQYMMKPLSSNIRNITSDNPVYNNVDHEDNVITGCVNTNEEQPYSQLTKNVYSFPRSITNVEVNVYDHTTFMQNSSSQDCENTYDHSFGPRNEDVYDIISRNRLDKSNKGFGVMEDSNQDNYDHMLGMMTDDSYDIIKRGDKRVNVEDLYS